MEPRQKRSKRYACPILKHLQPEFRNFLEELWILPIEERRVTAQARFQAIEE